MEYTCNAICLHPFKVFQYNIGLETGKEFGICSIRHFDTRFYVRPQSVVRVLSYTIGRGIDRRTANEIGGRGGGGCIHEFERGIVEARGLC